MSKVLKTAIVILARMNGAVAGLPLLAVLDRPLLSYQIQRLSRVRLADELIVAATLNEEDQPLVDFCRTHSVSYHRGDGHDPLSRCYEAALKMRADVVVLIGAESPLIDPRIVDRVLAAFGRGDRVDYMSNRLERTYPLGMECEALSFDSLEQAHNEASEPEELADITAFLRNRPRRFRMGNVRYESNCSQFDLSVKAPADIERVRMIVGSLAARMPAFTMEDCLSVLDGSPEWKERNCDKQPATLTA